MGLMIAKARLYLVADKSRLVREGDPKAAFLYATEGDEIPDSAVEQFGLVDGDLPATKSAAPEANKGKAPAANKGKAPAANKVTPPSGDGGASPPEGDGAVAPAEGAGTEGAGTEGAGPSGAGTEGAEA